MTVKRIINQHIVCGGSDLPAIPRQWLDAIVYLYPGEESAHASAPLGGTGFLMSVNPSPGLPPAAGHLYAVTNAHVIEAGAIHIRMNTHDGKFAVTLMQRDGWFLHPDGDDLALAPLGPNDAFLRFSCVPFEMSAPESVFDTDEKLAPGDDAFFLGRFAYRDGKISNTPTARFGSIAQVKGDPILQKDRNRYQESILVECHSLCGFSGSPVFAYRGARIGRSDTEGDQLAVIAQSGTRIYLLGVDWGSDPWTAEVRDKTTDQPIQPAEYVRASSGMALVVPAWKLRGALDHEDLAEFRRLREALMTKNIEEQEP